MERVINQELTRIFTQVADWFFTQSNLLLIGMRSINFRICSINYTMRLIHTDFGMY